MSFAYEAPLHKVIQLTWQDEPWRQVHVAIFSYPPKLPSSPAEFPKVELQRARIWLLRQLAQRDMASSQVRTKLRERLVSSRTIEELLNECLEAGYLDDTRYAENLVCTLNRRGKGPQYIQGKLRQLGLPMPQALGNQQETLSRLLQGRYAGKERQKVIQALLRRGFTLNAILEAL